MNLDERKNRILKSVVDRFVETNEPVSSQRLSLEFGLSSASIRNELNALLHFGYLKQPHVSGGRIPTENGYRRFVDALMEEARLSGEGLARFNACLAEIQTTLSELFSELTEALATALGYIAYVGAPEAEESAVKRIEIALVSPACCLLVLVLANGAVETKLAHLPSHLDEAGLRRMAEGLSDRLSGVKLSQIDDETLERMFREIRLREASLRIALAQFFEEIALSLGGMFYMEGTRRLLDQPEFARSTDLKPVLEGMKNEAGRAFLGKLPASAADPQVSIGSENGMEAFLSCSLVRSAFQFSDGTQGVVGVIGPTRMRYPQTVGLVRCAAWTLTDRLRQFSLT